MWQNKSVSVILPAFNEEENIASAVADFSIPKIVDEVVVVDNNCTDRTAEIAKKFGAKVVKEPKQGYGFALRRGMLEASGDLIILAEPDGTFDPKDVVKLLEKSSNFDLVLGSRTSPKFIKKNANMGPFLRLGNIFMAKVLQFLFLTPSISDCGCTLRLVKREMLSKILPKFTVGGSYFLPEMVILVKKLGGKITEVPINYSPRIGKSKITGSFGRAFNVGLSMFFLILRYRFK